MNFYRKLLLASPIIILIPALYFIHYTVDYFKDVTYSFVLNTNIGSVQMLEQELKEHQETEENYSEVRTAIIHMFNNTIGKKYSVITFLTDKSGGIYHSNHENELYLASLLENKDGLLAKTSDALSGTLTLQNSEEEQLWYYHTFYDVNESYIFFMSVDRGMLEAMLDTNNIVIPTGIICLLLIISIEDSIWLRISRRNKKEGELKQNEN